MAECRPGAEDRKANPLYALFLLVAIFAQAFFALVRGHFVAFSFLSVRHENKL